MHELIPGRLWVGNSMEARDTRRVLDLGIAAMVDLAIEELPPPLVRELIYCRIPISDGAGNVKTTLNLAIETTEHLIREKVPTLVYCGAGMSRSLAIASAAWSIVQASPPGVVLQSVVADRPHDVSPALWGDIVNTLNSR